MSPHFFPYSHLKFRSGIPVIAVSGHHIQLLDPATGTVLFSTLNSPPNVQESLKRSGPIRCAVLDNSNTHLATLADDKKLKVWKLDGLELLHERELPKRPTSATFTADGQTIVAADKFGDVFSYSLHPTPGTEPQGSASGSSLQNDGTPSGEGDTGNGATPVAETSSKKRKSKKPKIHENPPAPRNSLASHVSTSNGTLVLGHTSLLACFLLTPDNKYIITADRDEHIRVSWYPQGYCIESFCLGHTQFVSAIHIPSDRPDTLISGGGDAELKVWNWLTGKQKLDIPILDSVKPYILVKVKPYKRSAFTSASKESADRSTEGAEDQEFVQAIDADESQTVLAVQKIRTLSNHLLFTVTGGSALFSVPFPDDTTTNHSVYPIDFGKPVLDFTIAPDQRIWVTLDSNWTEDGVGPPEGKAIQLVELSDDGKLLNVSSTSSSPVLEALQKKCLVEASVEELSKLEFYASLKSLPKNTGEYDGDEEDSGSVTTRATGIPTNIKTNTRKNLQGSGGGKKEQGKLKSQKAVAEKKRKLGHQSLDRDDDMNLHSDNLDASNAGQLRSGDLLVEDDVEGDPMLS
ncbi:WD40-repeat-containing domain protein [Lentinula raphanica]|nr:WD40-repeat-containing domain protein [Lentinula raphanica]